MDFQKIGTFIATERKAKNYTQAQLAEKLAVSPKTVSKWENGNGVPETSLLQPLCDLFGINLNELLSGTRFNNEKDYHASAEDNLTTLLAERRSNRQKIWFSVITCALGVSTLLVCTLLAGYLAMPNWLSSCLVAYGVVAMILSLIQGVYYDMHVGSFECRHCGKKFTASTRAYLLGVHSITTRWLRCPHCGKSSFCRKRLDNPDQPA